MSSKSIHTNTYMIHTFNVHNTYINSVFVFYLYWSVCSYSFVYCLYVRAEYVQIHTKYIQIHTNTCDTSNTTGQKPVVVEGSQYKQIHVNTYIIHAKYMQIHANTKPSTTTGFCPVMSVLGLYWLVIACM